MSDSHSRKRGEIIDNWRLDKQLGAGGNAEVWQAEDKDHQKVALKILRKKDSSSERYKRFAVEISTLQRLGAQPGVLPLIASSLPDEPTKNRPAWLATPLAIPIREALSEQSGIIAVVEAIASIAQTLAKLAADHGIYHRDIKPENLYFLEGHWYVGDFGLVEFPEKEPLTEQGKHIGPRHYLAPELLVNPESAPGPTDVYSLAKTLWVLATAHSQPLPGHLSPYIEQTRISTYLTGVKIRPLELLVGRATHPDPAQRPRMADIATELEAWLHPDQTQPVEMAIDTLRAQILPLVERQKEANQRRQDREAHIRALLNAVEPALREIGSYIKQAVGITPQYNAWSIFSGWPPVTQMNHMPELSFGRHVALHIEVQLGTVAGIAHVKFLSGIALGAMNDDETQMIAAHLLWSSPDRLECLWSDSRAAALGSALEEKYRHELMAGLRNNLPQALVVFGQKLDN